MYQKAIREVGVYEPLPIKDDALEMFKFRWSSKGLGWFVDVLHESKIEGYTTVFAYYGSSTYNSKEMSILVDYIVQEAQELEIETKTPDEINKVKGLWSNE